MKIEHIEVCGINASIRALRNPMDSWDRSDSYNLHDDEFIHCRDKTIEGIEGFVLGDLDKALSQKLVKAGSEHCKHLRLIQTWMDLTLPRYLWQEFDTYAHISKVSCSTMHKLTSYTLDNSFFEYPLSQKDIADLNKLIERYKISKDIKDFYKLKNKLSEGFLQKRTINVNYQSWLNIYNQRSNHKLEQWQQICSMILNLPYFKELTGI